VAPARARDRLAAHLIGTHAIVGDLLEEGRLELGEALAHAHDGQRDYPCAS
jgi:hypothetical protein